MAVGAFRHAEEKDHSDVVCCNGGGGCGRPCGGSIRGTTSEHWVLVAWGGQASRAAPAG